MPDSERISLSSLSAAQIETIRAALRGEGLQPVAQRFEITASRAHGHVQAVALTMQRLGLASLAGSKPCRERELVMVGERGMISNKAIAELRETDGIAWITTLKSVLIRALIEQGHLQLGLFDERNLLELSSADYPGERLVACRNPDLARPRAHKREELLAATERSLAKIKVRVDAAKLSRRDAIGLRVGRIIDQYKMAQHFDLTIGDNAFTFARKHECIAAETALEGTSG